MNKFPDKIEPLTIPEPLVRLTEAIHNVCSDEQRLYLAPLLEAVTEDTTRRRRILSLIQDAQEQLRFDLKYIIFDLEATRRERDELRSRAI